MSGDGMSDFITALTAGVSSDALWGEAVNAVPLIIAVVLFVFGYTIIRRVTKGAAKGKFKM